MCAIKIMYLLLSKTNNLHTLLFLYKFIYTLQRHIYTYLQFIHQAHIVIVVVINFSLAYQTAHIFCSPAQQTHTHTQQLHAVKHFLQKHVTLELRVNEANTYAYTRTYVCTNVY